jgi:hypothetical protein
MCGTGCQLSLKFLHETKCLKATLISAGVPQSAYTAQFGVPAAKTFRCSDRYSSLLYFYGFLPFFYGSSAQTTEMLITQARP